MAMETMGETSRGSNARTVIRKNSQGSDSERSVAPRNTRSHQPPRYPAVAPAMAAIAVASNAAAGASSSEMRVPYSNRDRRSRPSSSVPSG